MIRVVVVDDSALARKLVSGMLESDPEIEVVGTAMNGIFGLRRVYRDRPDVVTMDFEMPQLDGLETLKTIMERRPTPVVMLSAHTARGMELTMKALELGAVDFVTKPDGRQSEVLGALREELVEKVKAAARARMPKAETAAAEDPEAPASEPAPVPRATLTPTPPPRPRPDRVRTPTPVPAVRGSEVELIAIGSSTGGVPGVERIIKSLPANAPPAVVVQHMPATFTASFAARLDRKCRVTVKEAEGGELLEPGIAIIARGDAHLGVTRENGALVAELGHGPKVSGHKPSADHLFRSCAREVGAACVGVILTGMGKDGAKGLKNIRDAGGATFAESEESCVVFGMPKTAIEIGAARHVVRSEEIPLRILRLMVSGR
ncbi:MAG: protein-glutamate methylesterase/protein-glutamine glutaminase [Planctomycetota bacterium]